MLYLVEWAIGRTHEQSSLLNMEDEGSQKATYWIGAKSFISPTTYGIACKFDAPTDKEELLIQKSPYLPNTSLQFRFELLVASKKSPP